MSKHERSRRMDYTELIVKLYEEGKSLREISEIIDMYPSRIRRILIKAGIQTRNRSDAAKTAIKTGRIKPPMQGKKVSSDTKKKISKGIAKNWKNRTEEEKENFKKGAKERWNEKTPEAIELMRERAGKALRAASIEGSKLEKFLYENLTKRGIHVKMHVTGLVVGEKYEVDLFLPEKLIAIEIDGPHHFKEIYKSGNLRKTIEFDTIKNGALMQRGIRVIRIKYLSKHNSLFINENALQLILRTIDQIENNPEDRTNMLIELEIVNEQEKR